MYEDLTYFSAKKMLMENDQTTTWPSLNTVILRNVTVDQIDVFYNYFCAEFSVKSHCTFGGFDTILQDIISTENQIISHFNDIIVVFYNIGFAYPILEHNYHTLTATELEAISDDILLYVETCLVNIRKNSNALVLWPSFERYLYSALGIKDNVYNGGINHFISRLNHEIAMLFEKFSDCYFINTDNLCARIGEANFYDHVRCHSAASPYTLNALKAFALEFSKYARALKGKVKKCIVLDCDNTLWKGIVGETQISHLQVGKTGYPREAFYKFQLFVKQLSRKGIIVALCSKNNEEDVWNVFEDHQGMVLTRTDITTYQVNWNNKADNMLEIAKELNLGLNALVFVDDSEFECNLMREMLPDVDVIQMNDNPLETIQEIIERGLFDQYRITSEDNNRQKMYADEVKRKNSKIGAIDLQGYLASLQINITIVIDDIKNVPRLSQLTQKTNQFNCTTKRYSEAQISSFIESSDYTVFSLQMSDKFGDLGIVGVCITQLLPNKEVAIDTFLLSCRALGRDIETVFLSTLCMYFNQTNMANIIGTYIPSKKNSQVNNFFKKNGFSAKEKSNEIVIFRLELNKFIEKEHVFSKVEVIHGN